MPLYEAKIIHQFDHRWATYQPASTNSNNNDGDSSRDCALAEKANADFRVTPRYWVIAVEGDKQVAD